MQFFLQPAFCRIKHFQSYFVIFWKKEDKMLTTMLETRILGIFGVLHRYIRKVKSPKNLGSSGSYLLGVIAIDQ